MRSLREINAEIQKLQKLRPVGPHAPAIRKRLALAVDILSGYFDETSDEAAEMFESDSFLQDASDWKHGNIDDAPSEGWDGLAESA